MNPVLLRQRQVVPYTIAAANALDDDDWTKSNTTVTADAETAPDGFDTADKLIASATTSTHFARLSVTVTPGLHEASMSFKVGEHDEVRFLIDDGSATLCSRTIDLDTGDVIGNPTGNGWVVAQGDGWWRMTHRAVCRTTTMRVFVSMISGGLASFLGDDASGFYAADLRIGRVA